MLSNNLHNLHVLIPTRDRSILTQKVIESIHQNSTHFKNIRIYVFDNYSDPIEERFSIFSKLLKNKQIVYYSYDTPISTYECFPKIPIHKRWRDMMIVDKEIRRRKGVEVNLKDYYLLLDNDMLVGPKWDEYFISTANLLAANKEVHFIVKWPGGIPAAASKVANKQQIGNEFNRHEKFILNISMAGGSSGFWFMDYNMLRKFEWPIDWMVKSYKKFKQHDSLAWQLIKSKHGQNVKYVAGVVPPDEDNPLVIHVGGKIGSICNSLTSNNYHSDKEEFVTKEENFKDVGGAKLFEQLKCKGTARW